MAKSDSFFIRHSVDIGMDNAYRQEAIDLGAYVDALGKSVLRIHNAAISFTDAGGRSPELDGSDAAAAAQFQLVTQTQNDIVLPSNKSVISSGMINCARVKSGNGVADSTSESFDNVPQLWTNGYLVAVDQIYLGGAATTTFYESVTVTVVLECTVETMSQAAAMALALSQQ
jgi:hypothetical protein